MKITITQEFNSFEEAQSFLSKLVPQTVNITVQPPAGILGAQPAAETTKPARKPRSDAGKSRGPHKPDANAGAGSASPGTPNVATSGAGPAGSTPAPTTPAPAAASSAAEPAFEDAKAALKRVNDTKGLGTPACIQHLQEFGVNKISDLPKEKFALFIKQADAKIAEHLAATKK